MAGKSLLEKCAVVAGSMLIAYSVGPAVAEWSGFRVEIVSAIVALSAQNIAVLLSDRAAFVEMLKAWREK